MLWFAVWCVQRELTWSAWVRSGVGMNNKVNFRAWCILSTYFLDHHFNFLQRVTKIFVMILNYDWLWLAVIVLPNYLITLLYVIYYVMQKKCKITVQGLPLHMSCFNRSKSPRTCSYGPAPWYCFVSENDSVTVDDKCLETNFEWHFDKMMKFWE